MEQTKDGVKNLPTKPFRIYYNPRLINVDDIRKSIVRTVGMWSHHDLDIQRYKSESTTLEWRCFFCHTKIDVDIKNFSGKDMFCDNHKPKIFSNKYKENPLLMRYISSFYEKVRQRIINNTDIKELYG